MAEKLAIHGGKRIIPDGLIQPWPQVTKSDRDAIAEVIASDKDYRTAADPIRRLIKRMGGIHGGSVLYSC